MKGILQIILILAFPNLMEGQSWAPIGAKWSFGIGYAWSTDINYNEWVCTSDTLVGGHLCKLIKRNGSSVDSDISNKLITYEDSNSIYWYNPLLNQFTTLYDFNKNAGENWTMQIDPACDLLITVDSTDIETINGYPLKVLYLSSDDHAFFGKTIQHIGNINMPNPFIMFHCYGVISDGSYYTGLRCYEDSTFGFYNLNNTPTCDYVTVGVTAPDIDSRIYIYPNPTADFIHINNLSGHDITDVSLYSLDPQHIINLKFTNQDLLDLSNIPSGVYILKIMHFKTVIHKIIIKNN